MNGVGASSMIHAGVSKDCFDEVKVNDDTTVNRKLVEKKNLNDNAASEVKKHEGGEEEWTELKPLTK